jgi:gamma-glutamyl:cysteine ligase YbdK (ATP-grasp superfamily)
MAYNLFEVFGVEMEYMIVDRDTLNVRPIADLLIKEVEGEIVSETEQGELAWCNELVSHVIELKTNGPTKSLNGIAGLFQHDVKRINEILSKWNACLMPTAMHPWMDPYTETKLWEHEYSAIYETFNAIFDCRGHGWANLQSTHLNLPFSGDEEFGQLHAAIRAILPILPVLSASSPVMDGKVTGILDNRLSVYRTNARRVPSVSGKVIPEPCYTEHDYRTILLQKIYDDIAPLDPDGILQDEWLNARGAIARFDRGAIEIRVLDLQEHPGVDVAILQFTVGVLKALMSKRWVDMKTLMALDMEAMSDLLTRTTASAGNAAIVLPGFGACFGNATAMTAGELWKYLYSELADEIWSEGDPGKDYIKTILDNGNLSQRIVSALGENPTNQRIFEVYRALGESLNSGKMFLGA